MNKFSQIKFQEETVDAILSLPEQGRRSASYGLTILNKKARGVSAIRKQFERTLTHHGYSPESIETQWMDVKDMAKLEATAK